MKLGKDVLVAIVAIVQDGILNGSDVSEKLRNLDLSPSYEDPAILELVKESPPKVQ